MYKYLPLLLFIGLAWGQGDSDLDIIEMKTGFIYKGKITDATPNQVTIIPQYESTSLTIFRKEIEKITTPVSRGEIEIQNSEIINLLKQKPPLFSSGAHLQKASNCSILSLLINSVTILYLSEVIKFENQKQITKALFISSTICSFYTILQIGEAGDDLKKASLKLVQQEKELKRISKELERKKND